MAPFPLRLPERARKPRRVGLTHVLDKGMPPRLAVDLLASGGAYIDVWKFGWGTAYIDPGLEAKLALLAEHGVLGCPGGTLFEVAWTQGRVEEFLTWAGDLGFPCVEISRGVAAMTPREKCHLIRRAAADFTVLAEVGAKSSTDRLPCDQWATEVTADLEAGATWVLTEGRESGTVGVYDDDGGIRQDIVDCVVEAAGVERVVFEAPQKDQQAWFIKRFGADVNLANIPVTEVPGLETLRLGLRADTVNLAFPAPPPVPASVAEANGRR